MNTTIYYLLNEEGRRKSLLAGGNGEELQSLKTDDRQALEMADVDKNGNASLCVGFRGIGNQGYILLDIQFEERSDGEPYWGEELDKHLFSGPQMVENLLIWETARRFTIKNYKSQHQAEFDAKMEAYQKKEAEKEAKFREEEETRRIEQGREKMQEEAEKEVRGKNKHDWIRKNGTDYLKLAIDMGYNCQRRYVEERTAMELKDFAVDFDDEIRYRSRSCPGQEALLETKVLIEKGFEARVIWLTKEIGNRNEDYDFEECEAILVERYLGKYDCIKLV